MQLNTMLYIVPDLMNLFVPGFIFIKLLSWLNNKKFETSTTRSEERRVGKEC